MFDAEINNRGERFSLSHVRKNLVEFLQDHDLPIRYLSKELGLLRPEPKYSVAGILPEVLKQWNYELDLTDCKNLSSFNSLEKRILEAHPHGYNNILFIVVDGIGVQDLNRIGGIIDTNVKTKGTIATSTFPTITSSVMTSLHYGTEPSCHGVVGYNYYNEKLDHVYNALRLRYLDTENLVQEALNKVNLDDLATGPSLTALIDQQVGAEIAFYVPNYLKPPGLGNILNRTFDQIGYSSHEDAFAMVKNQLEKKTNQFVGLYLPDPDSAGHMMGSDSDGYTYAIRIVEHLISNLCELQTVKEGSTLVILTSDHGQVPVNDLISSAMNKVTWQSYVQQGTMFSTSGYTVHAYAIDGDLEKSRSLIDSIINHDNTMVIDKKEAIKLSGGSTLHQERYSDFSILSTNGYLFHIPDSLTIDTEELHFGHHGSLSTRELYVPVGIFSGYG